MTIAQEVVVSGRVQGVFFRTSLRRVAERNGVAGWVRNEPNGTVRAYLEGTEEAVGQVLGWIREGGPEDALVRAVNLADRVPSGIEGFSVRHS
jgi:acylphosphatase